MATREDRRAAALAAALPPAALLVAGLVTAPGREGVFQSDLAALVAATAVGAFVARARALPLLGLAGGALLCAPAHLAAGGGLDGAPALMLLALAVAAAAAGLAAVGRGLGAGSVASGVAAAAVLQIAMTGLLWADDVGDGVPHARRFAFKQAVLYLDPATACAYDAAGFDRFHEPRIYDRVRLTSSGVRAPGAGPTGATWLLVGLLALGAARLLGAARRVPPEPA